MFQFRGAWRFAWGNKPTKAHPRGGRDWPDIRVRPKMEFTRVPFGVTNASEELVATFPSLNNSTVGGHAWEECSTILVLCKVDSHFRWLCLSTSENARYSTGRSGNKRKFWTMQTMRYWPLHDLRSRVRCLSDGGCQAVRNPEPR